MRKVVLGLIIVVLLAGCAEHEDINMTTDHVTNVSDNVITANNITISQIKSDPSEFVGKKVVIHGIYMGWRGDGPPPVTRSDWVIDDGTGRIYVTGIVPNLDPVKDIGKNLTVIGYVRIINDRVYIEAVKVEIE
mgnify:CR=1 FL=1